MSRSPLRCPSSSSSPLRGQWRRRHSHPPPPPLIVVLMVLFCPASVGGLSCCGCCVSCRSSTCAAAAVTTVISLTISIAEYVIVWGCCSLLLTTITMFPPLHPPFPALLPFLGVGNGDNNLGQWDVVSDSGHNVDVHRKCG